MATKSPRIVIIGSVIKQGVVKEVCGESCLILQRVIFGWCKTSPMKSQCWWEGADLSCMSLLEEHHRLRSCSRLEEWVLSWMQEGSGEMSAWTCSLKAEVL